MYFRVHLCVLLVFVCAQVVDEKCFSYAQSTNEKLDQDANKKPTDPLISVLDRINQIKSTLTALIQYKIGKLQHQLLTGSPLTNAVLPPGIPGLPSALQPPRPYIAQALIAPPQAQPGTSWIAQAGLVMPQTGYPGAASQPFMFRPLAQFALNSPTQQLGAATSPGAHTGGGSSVAATASTTSALLRPPSSTGTQLPIIPQLIAPMPLPPLGSTVAAPQVERPATNGAKPPGSSVTVTQTNGLNLPAFPTAIPLPSIPALPLPRPSTIPLPTIPALPLALPTAIPLPTVPGLPLPKPTAIPLSLPTTAGTVSGLSSAAAALGSAAGQAAGIVSGLPSAAAALGSAAGQAAEQAAGIVAGLPTAAAALGSAAGQAAGTVSGLPPAAAAALGNAAGQAAGSVLSGVTAPLTQPLASLPFLGPAAQASNLAGAAAGAAGAAAGAAASTLGQIGSALGQAVPAVKPVNTSQTLAVSLPGVTIPVPQLGVASQSAPVSPSTAPTGSATQSAMTPQSTVVVPSVQFDERTKPRAVLLIR